MFPMALKYAQLRVSVGQFLVCPKSLSFYLVLLFGAVAADDAYFPYYMRPSNREDVGSYLIYRNKNLTWNNARTLCEGTNRTLVKLADDNAIVMLTARGRVEFTSLWIGLMLIKDTVTGNDTGMWSDCSPYVAADYDTPFERSGNKGSDDKRCAIITTESTWQWSDCREVHGFVCENRPDDFFSYIKKDSFPQCDDPSSYVGGKCPHNQCNNAAEIDNSTSGVQDICTEDSDEVPQKGFCVEQEKVAPTYSSVFAEVMQTSSPVSVEDMLTSSPIPVEDMLTSSSVLAEEMLTSSPIVSSSEMELMETSSVPDFQLIVTSSVPVPEPTSSLLLHMTSSLPPEVVTSSPIEPTTILLSTANVLISAILVNDTVAPSPAVCNTSCKADFFCACRCVKTVVITHEEWRIIQDSKARWIASVVDELSLNKSSFSATRRRYHSATDTRKSVQYIGSVGTIILIIFFGGIVLLDMSALLNDIRMLIRNLRLVGNDWLRQE